MDRPVLNVWPLGGRGSQEFVSVVNWLVMFGTSPKDRVVGPLPYMAF